MDRHVVHVGMVSHGARRRDSRGAAPSLHVTDLGLVHVQRVGPEVEKTYVPQGQEGFRIGGCRWQQPPTMWSPFGGEGPE